MSPIPARTPVAIGAAVVRQREDDPACALGALELIVRAARAAAVDSGAPEVLARSGWVGALQGSWSVANPAGFVAERVGDPTAHTVLVPIGVPQQAVVTEAVRAVASGRCDVALAVGGEAMDRARRATRAGIEVGEPPVEGAPEERLEPPPFEVAPVERQVGLGAPVETYALLESAYAAAQGWTPSEHRERLGALCAAMADVARANPWAWDPSAPSADEIVTPTAANRMIATPYTKRMCSQWHVDLASAVLVCAYEVARRLGIREDRMVFPHAATVSLHTIPVVERAELGDSVGARVAGARVLELAKCDIDDIEHVELYSCFPVAVQVYARALGFAPDRVPTVTGGMAYAGGPYNNSVLQGNAAVIDCIRARGGRGLVSTAFGLLHRQAFAVWSHEPPAAGFRVDDVSTAVAAQARVRSSVEGASGTAVVVAATTVHERSGATKARVVAELADGTRTMAVAPDAPPDDGDGLTWIGREIELADGVLVGGPR